MEKRRAKRHTKRMQVRFGEKGFTTLGFTHDVSASGLFIVAASAPKLGTRLHVEVMVDSERALYFEALVQRLVQVPVQLRAAMKAGFGVRFLEGGELLQEMVPQRKDRLRFAYATADALKVAFDAELRRGGLFLKSTTRYAPDTVVPVDLELGFVQRTLELPMRVVHVMPDPAGGFGVALMFVDPQRAFALLGEVLPK